MARKPQITRTFRTNRITVLCLDVVTAESQNVTVTLPRVLNDEKKTMAAVKAAIETDTLKAVSIVDSVVVEQLYTMDEDFFLAHATLVASDDVKQNAAEA